MPGRLLRALGQRWRRYKYRFVPWIALNLSHNPRTVRYVPEDCRDKVISDEDVLETLLTVFQALFINDFNKQSDMLTLLPESVKSKYQDLLSVQQPRVGVLGNRHQRPSTFQPEEILYKTLGFSVALATSSLLAAGKGVFVTKGSVPKGAVVSMYPGTVYQKHEPVLFQSIGNPFILRCLDGVLIDGNDRGMSRVVYRSCSGRDQLGPFKMSDSTWLTPDVHNPLAIGQYVNNCSNERAANVCYQELDVPATFPVELKQYLPNVAYRCHAHRAVSEARGRCENSRVMLARPCPDLSLSRTVTSLVSPGDAEGFFSGSALSTQLLAVHVRPYGTPGIKPRSAACKANSLPLGYRSGSQNLIIGRNLLEGLKESYLAYYLRYLPIKTHC